MKASDITIAGRTVAPGERIQFDLPAAQLFTHTQLGMTVEVIHGTAEGPVLLICAAIHGDELNGVEIIRRLRTLSVLKHLKGTLVLVPVVNLHGFLNKSRYLPDRRDLNRCFPGNERGSLGSRIANLFFTEIVCKCTHVIDLHTAAVHRDNLPQIRAALDAPGVKEMALGFSIPVIINAGLIDNSLRAEAGKRGIPVVTYEAGEALRLSEKAIVTGVRGIVNLMRGLGLLRARRTKTAAAEPSIAGASRWYRAPIDGVFRPLVRLGARVKDGDVLGSVTSPFDSTEAPVIAKQDGIVIGGNNLPLVHQGEALYHVGEFEQLKSLEETLSAHKEEIETDPLYEVEQVQDIELR